MDAKQWDERYDQSDLVWSAGPNQWVEQVVGDQTSGTALDLAAGEGRNALWLAQRGWSATAVDFSAVALDRARRIADERLGDQADRFSTVCADLMAYTPTVAAYDLVLLVYLQVPARQRAAVLASAATAVAPGGRLVVVAHDLDNIERGYGGPQDASVLYSATDVTADLAGSGLRIDRAEQVTRAVDTPDGQRQALDLVVVAARA